MSSVKFAGLSSWFSQIYLCGLRLNLTQVRGRICMIVATFLYLLAMLLAYLGLLKILTFKPFIPPKRLVSDLFIHL